jgi:hypothetical protein
VARYYITSERFRKTPTESSPTEILFRISERGFFSFFELQEKAPPTVNTAQASDLAGTIRKGFSPPG